MNVIRLALEKELQQKKTAGWLFMALGVLMIFFFAAKIQLFAILGFLSVFGGVWLLSKTIRIRSLEQLPELQILLHEPQKVVWIYSVITQRMPFGFKMSAYGLVYLNMKDGATHCIEVPVEKLKLVTKYLSRLLPNVVVGYSEARAEQFDINPNEVR